MRCGGNGQRGAGRYPNVIGAVINKEKQGDTRMRCGGNRQREAESARMRCGGNGQRGNGIPDYKSGQWKNISKRKENRLEVGRMEESLAGRGLGMGEGADFFCHAVESDAVLTRDVALVWVVFPWTENQDTAFGDSVKKCI